MAGLQREKLGIIVDRFYEAAAQPGLWRAVLHETGLALGAAGATIVSYTGSHVATLCSEGMDEFADAFVREEWHLRNPRRARVTALTRSRRDVITGLMCFTPEEFDRLP